MADEAFEDPTCAVCGRRLLPGESPIDYVTREGIEVTVCELCKPRAEAAGWLRPDEAEALRAAGVGRERRRPRGQMLSGLLSRFPAPPAEREPQEEPEPRPARARRRPPEASPEPAGAEADSRAAGPGRAAGPPEPPATKPATTLPEALAAFNVSNHRRTVAGLTRTLGPPRATAVAVRSKNGFPGVRLTVAWEITWYQWEVTPGAAGPEVRESGKGDTIDQLRTADRRWNLRPDPDGTLHEGTTTELPPPEPVDTQ
jgi:hypothetical protein